MISNQVKNQHLMWRAGFGPAAAQLGELATVNPKDLFKALQKAAADKPTYLDATDDYLKGLVQNVMDAGLRKKQLDAEERKNLQQQVRYAIKNLNLAWVNEMVDTNAQLREKMAFFWHGHFACRQLNVFHQQDLLQVIRENALGNFRDLLFGVSKSASMLNFLNAQQNRKDHPNENFAREVMELFTLGRGNYTEHDIKEAARAFTGWSANPKGEFVFRKFQHDDNTKTVLGKTGNFSGEDVLNILLEQKQTARYITQKIYRFYVNENVDKAKVDWLADRFYKSEYNIGKLLEDIFTSDWFYDPKNIGVKIKSPIELMVGIQRMLPMKIDNEDSLLMMQRLLGQVLFYPPNVAGWPGGKSWIDSSTLMVRMRIPQMLNEADELNVRPKADDDQAPEMKMTKAKNNNMGKAGKPINVTIDWKNYISAYASVSRESLVKSLSTSLLQTSPSYKEDLITNYADSSARDSFIRSATLQIMSTPEYQMC